MSEYYEMYMRCFPEYQTSREVFFEQLKPEEARIFAEYDGGRLIGYAMVHKGSVAILWRRRGLSAARHWQPPAYRRRGVPSQPGCGEADPGAWNALPFAGRA